MQPIREIPIGKVVLLGILTLSIYYWIWVFRSSKDLHQDQPDGHNLWQLWFWLGIPTLGVTLIVLYVFNVIQANNLRKLAGMSESATGWIAFALNIGSYFTAITGFIAPFVWAMFVNEMATKDTLSAPAPLAATA